LRHCAIRGYATPANPGARRRRTEVRSRTPAETRENIVSSVPAAESQLYLTRALGAFVLLTMVLAVVYAVWIAISNFSRIGV
jgi:hypothetical protein